MPLLSRNREEARALAYHPAAGGRVPVDIVPADRAPFRERRSFFESCANPHCTSGRLKIWRSRRTPTFEDGWCCSPACMRAQVDAALNREMSRETGLRTSAAAAHRPRLPLGLVMLEQGWINAAQLRRALEAQRATQTGRFGQWPVRQRAANEDQVTRALGLQWSCPVLHVERHDAESMARLLPRLFVDAFGALPLRVVSSKILYLGFEDRPDPVLALAVERMTGLRVESALVQGSAFRAAHAEMLAARYPHVSLVEAASESLLAAAFLKAIHRCRPLVARLVRVHDCVWMRMSLRSQISRLPPADAVEDVIGSIAGP